MPDVPLTGSVGANAQNESADVIAVKRRFHEIGFDWLDESGTADGEFKRVIRLFQAIKSGRGEVAGQNGLIDVDGETHLWLMAANCPRWQMIRESAAHVGFVKLIQPGDDHDFGTDWLFQSIVGAGAAYHRDHLAAHPKASRIVINDVSPAKGGNSPEHLGHETGLMCDNQLPHKDGRAGGITYRDAAYDRAACRRMLIALREQPLANQDKIFFNDPELIDAGLSIYEPDPLQAE